MSHRQYFTVLAGLLSLRTAVERGRCWKYIKTAVRARARSGRVRAAELADQLAAGCRLSELAARQLDLLLEQLFGAPCVAPCAREPVEPRATTFAKPRGFHQGARGCGDKGNERCPQRRVGAFTASSTRRISAFPARQGEPRCGPALAKVANGCRRAAPPRVGAAGPAQRPQGRRERHRRAPGRPCPPRAPLQVQASK